MPSEVLKRSENIRMNKADFGGGAWESVECVVYIY